MASTKKQKAETKSQEARTIKTATKTKSKSRTRSLQTVRKDEMKTKTKNKNNVNNSNSNKISNGVVKKKASNGNAEDSSAKKTSREAGKSNPKKDKRKLAREEEQNGYEEREYEKIYRFPINRVNKIIRSEEVDFRINHEAIFLVSKATEKFLEQFSEDAYECCVQNRKKSLAYNHLSSVVFTQRRYDFLSDFVPERIKAVDALTDEGPGWNLSTCSNEENESI